MKKMASLYKDCFSIFARTTSDIVICLDKNFVITLLNPVAENFYHRKTKETAGLSYFSFPSDQKPVFSKKELEKLSFKRSASKRRKIFNNHSTVLWSVDCLFDSHNQSKGFLIIGKVQSSKPRKNKLIFKLPKENVSLEELIFNWSDNVFWSNRESVYLGCNKEQADNFGIKPEEVVGQTIYALAENLHWDRRLADEIYINDQEVMRTGKSILREEQAIWTDGKERITLSRKMPIINEKGKCIGLFGIATDITELKEREDQIKRDKETSEQKNIETEIYLEHLISNLPDNVYWSDREGAYKDCNNQQLLNLGLQKNEFIGKTIYDIAAMFHWDKKLADDIYINDQEVMRTGKPIVREERVVWLDGKERTNLSRKIPIKDDKGNCVGLLGVSTDITELKEREDKIKRDQEASEQKNIETEIYLEHLIANLPDNIYWSDRKGVYKGCNKQQADSFNLAPEDFVGQTIYTLAEIFHWDENLADEIHKNDQEVMRTGKPLIKEEAVIWKDGKERIYLSRKLPATDARGNCVGLLGISTEITQLKEVEYALRNANEKSEALNKAKADFIANMSHDVKTPLSGIISISEALCSRVQEEYRELTHDILQSAQHLMAFFTNCIELSKLENGAIALPEETFSLKKLLNEIADLFKPTIKAKRLGLYVNCSEAIPTNLLGSRVILYRILLNLIGNAVKFTHQGSITLKAELSQNSTSQRAVIKLTVADTGIGIPGDKQKVIFERFARLTPSYQGSYEGSGIGLYIVDEFVKSMKGEVHVKSKEGEGSLFTIVVPFQVPLLAENEYGASLEISQSIDSTKLFSSEVIAKNFLDKPPFLQNVKSSRSKKGSSQPKVLLVEDSLIAQKGVTLLLNSLGCDVDVAASGKEAIKLFKAGHYVLVLMDLGLPDMKGYEIAECFKKLERNTSFSVPIIGLSAHVTQEEREISKEMGMIEIFSKPLLMDQAVVILKQYVPHLDILKL